MSWASARHALDMAKVAVDGLELIEKITNVGGDKADAILAATKAAIVALREGFDGKTSPQIVLSQLEALHDSLRLNDAAADAALRSKFPG